jgi:acetolactate synthase I/II/III large subunit
LPTEHPNFVGRIGTIGDRAGNFAIQNSDLVLAVGTRNNIRQISYSWDFFARNAKKIVVDIDAAELKKPTLSPDLAIHCNAVDFMQLINSELKSHKKTNYQEWVDWCIERKFKYPTVLTEYSKVTDGIQPYVFINTLTELLDDQYIVVAGNGSACVVLFQAGVVKENQRIFWNSGCASMGYDLPAAIGAHFASGKKVICLAGDGSIMMNLQELQTIKYYNLPIKIFVLNNSGYCSIKQTQDSFFEGRRVACDSSCGVGFPAFSDLASAFGISSVSLKKHGEMHDGIKDIIASEDPFLCEVCLTNNYSFSPKLSSQKKDDGRIISKPLEDMYPFLDRKEFIENLLIPPVEED